MSCFVAKLSWNVQRESHSRNDLKEESTSERNTFHKVIHRTCLLWIPECCSEYILSPSSLLVLSLCSYKSLVISIDMPVFTTYCLLFDIGDRRKSVEIFKCNVWKKIHLRRMDMLLVQGQLPMVFVVTLICGYMDWLKSYKPMLSRYIMVSFSFLNCKSQ